jgi:hypothetical protein
MGNSFNKDDIKKPPRYHFNCRYDKEDPRCNKTALFTRTKDVFVSNKMLLLIIVFEIKEKK